MTFSASPLVPDQRQPVDDAWKPAAQLVLSAVAEASAQVPSAEPLVPDAPVADASAVTMPDPAGAAVTAVLGGGLDGTLLVVVGAELVEALQGTPFGDLEPAQALRPALEALATALGGRLESSPTAVDVADCLEVVTAGPITVLVPLLGGETVHALVAVRLDGLPGAAAPAAAAAGTPTAGQAARSWGIDMLRDVEMEVTCELGRTKMTVRQLLALSPGDVVELDRLAGAPADLLVNGTLLARGEVVVVDESFGLRITEIVTKDAT
ncbi:flagellar motor switch protein FliN [Kineosporia sp. R_H_3]|uniref:flagellar motor switch protein FliN n=1 Tax=Kineosporia sp. R_H_3 TaxID=1961848 RepID=UPI000B4AA528|nr:flagellar motor switch protein FliN [Kineosporia sp. R_H_3]